MSTHISPLINAYIRAIGITVVAVGLRSTARAGWEPTNGDWSKSHMRDIRVMTWNVFDTIRTTATKSEGQNAWTAAARIVAAMQPDVLCLQETGDNVFGVDTVADLQITLDLFLNGGNDPFFAGSPAVTAYVGKYAPQFVAPHVFVSECTDGFNRNVIISRHPFADLNGDGRTTMSDIPSVHSDLYAPGGDGGIRGFQFAEIDLANVPWRGDAMVGNAHLKAGGDAGDFAQRLRAGQNVVYVVDYWLNGADDGTPDPRDQILDDPAATQTLDAFTLVVLGGDWNQEPTQTSTRGPAEWLTQAEFEDGNDGADRDRSDAAHDQAVHLFTGNPATLGDKKFDYIAWQDSIASSRRSFVFDTAGTPPFALPNELSGFLSPSQASDIASDHRPVIVDLQLPIIHDADDNHQIDIYDFASFDDCRTGPDGKSNPECNTHDTDRDNDIDLLDFAAFQQIFD